MPADNTPPAVERVRRRNNELHVRYRDGRRVIVRQAVPGRYASPGTYGFGPDGGYTVEVSR